MCLDMEAERDYTKSAREKKAQANGCMMSKVTEKTVNSIN